METKMSPISESIVVSENDAALDASCKNLLAFKEILAQILKEIAKEFRDCAIPDIISLMSEPQVGSVPVNPGMENAAAKVGSMGEEDASVSEGTVRYDIRFRVRLPKSQESTELIVNIEAQNNFNPGYSLVTRGIYYVGRMISSQKESDYGFAGSNYQRLKKVYSIWICVKPAAEWRNTITLYQLEEKNLVGKAHETQQNYDKLCVAIVGLGDGKDKSASGILRLLQALLSDMPVHEKEEILEKEFGIQTTQPLRKEMEDMCNYSKGVREEALEEGIVIMISTLFEIGLSSDEIVQKLMSGYQLSKEDAQKYVADYQAAHK